MYKIAIDGPSASGKTEVAKAIGSKLKILVVDTGAIYRAVTLYCLQNGVKIEDTRKVISSAKDLDISLEGNEVFLNGENVSKLIRTSDISKATAVVAQIPEIREQVAKIQREIANSQNVVMQGRDITSVVLPDAQIKIYLNATPEERANRRYKELIAKGEIISFEQVLKDIHERDRKDMTREISPLVKTEDSIEIDTTCLTLEEVVEKIIEIIRKRGLI